MGDRPLRSTTGWGLTRRLQNTSHDTFTRVQGKALSAHDRVQSVTPFVEPQASQSQDQSLTNGVVAR